MKAPEYYADKARAAQAAGDWLEAAKQWDSAKAASIGHKRRDRYEAAAEHCRAMAEGKGEG